MPITKQRNIHSPPLLALNLAMIIPHKVSTLPVFSSIDDLLLQPEIKGINKKEARKLGISKRDGFLKMINWDSKEAHDVISKHWSDICSISKNIISSLSEGPDGWWYGNLDKNNHFTDNRHKTSPRIVVLTVTMLAILSEKLHLDKFGFSLYDLSAWISVESKFSPAIKSYKGAIGLAQIMPSTWRDVINPISFKLSEKFFHKMTGSNLYSPNGISISTRKNGLLFDNQIAAFGLVIIRKLVILYYKNKLNLKNLASAKSKILKAYNPNDSSYVQSIAYVKSKLKIPPEFAKKTTSSSKVKDISNVDKIPKHSNKETYYSAFFSNKGSKGRSLDDEFKGNKALTKSEKKAIYSCISAMVSEANKLSSSKTNSIFPYFLSRMKWFDDKFSPSSKGKKLNGMYLSSFRYFLISLKSALNSNSEDLDSNRGKLLKLIKESATTVFKKKLGVLGSKKLFEKIKNMKTSLY